MYPLDQVTESLITANFKEDTPEYPILHSFRANSGRINKVFPT